MRILPTRTGTTISREQPFSMMQETSAMGFLDENELEARFLSGRRTSMSVMRSGMRECRQD